MRHFTLDFDVGDFMTGAACRAGNAYPSRAPDFTSGLYRGSCSPVIYVSLVLVLSFVQRIFEFSPWFHCVVLCLLPCAIQSTLKHSIFSSNN